MRRHRTPGFQRALGALAWTIATLCLALPAAAAQSGRVFVLTNSTDPDRGNEVVVFDRGDEGDLQFRSSYGTGGAGSGPAPTSVVFGVPIPFTADGLGSQNSLVLNGRKQLFAVNAGSNSVTCFKITKDGLSRRTTVDSGGVFPTALAYRKGTLYVLNSGNEGRVVGFRVSKSCRMSPNGSSLDDLASWVSDPPFPTPAPNEVVTTAADVGFSTDGKRLVVSIKGLPSGAVGVVDVKAGKLRTDSLVVTAFDPATNTAGPFGFTFDRGGNLLLNHGSSFTFASYGIATDNSLLPISGPIPISGLGGSSPLAFGGFNCWVTRHGDVAYVMSFGDVPATNGGKPDGPGVISALRIASDGGLSLLPVNDFGAEGIVAVLPQDDRDDISPLVVGNHGIDLAEIGGFLYAPQPRLGKIGVFGIDADGGLTDLGLAGGLPEGVDPFAGTNPGINDFLVRCFDPPAGGRSPECERGSMQGIAGF